MMLQFNHLKKEYSGTTILSIEELLLPKGIILLQGENGSGKTTLLKIIAGLLPFDGDIIINNTFSIQKHRQEFMKLVNYAETEPLYPGFLTAKELVKFFCYCKHGSIKDIETLLEELNIIDVYKKPIATYSSGMIKKLSIALSFAGKPGLILLDEPLITTDKKAVETICTLINRKYQQQNISFLITSHQNFNNDQLLFTRNIYAHDHTITFAE